MLDIRQNIIDNVTLWLAVFPSWNLFLAVKFRMDVK
jgi:hypothetical protein